MKKRGFFALAVAALSLLRPADVIAQSSGEIAAAIDRDLRAAEAAGFGGAVIVQQGGRTLLRRGYGLANRRSNLRFTPATVAQIGSITKTFTGLAVAQLAAAGRIDLDATVGTYLRDAPEPVRSIILRDLAVHRSGLMDACADDFDRIGTARLTTHCMAQPLAHPRGENHYSNMGYSILARIVEAVSGEEWEAYLRRHIWTPLTMPATGFRFAPNGRHAFAHGYRDGVGQPVISDQIRALQGDDWALRGNGGIQASAEDMMRLLNALVSGPGVSAPVRRLMLSPQGPLEDGVAEGLGLFFRNDEQGALWRVGHAGSDGVFMSYVAWFPQSGTLLYFVGNNGEAAVRPVLQSVLRQAARFRAPAAASPPGA